MKKILALMLALAMCLGCVAFAEEETATYAVGAPLPDFTFTAIDGTTYTLSEVLKEKDMVMINLWATWCGPCRNEFPYMEQAYEQYKDKIEIFALSVEETDDVETLTAFAADYGLTFPIGRDDTNIFGGFGLNGVPTSLVVDRFGNVAFLEVGSQTAVGNFTRLFDVFVDENYTESIVLDEIPAAKPNVPAADESDLAAALNVEGGVLTFTNPTDDTTWPMVIATEGDRTYVVNSNVEQDRTTAAVYMTVDAKAGDVLAFDYKVSTEAGCDMATLYVNDAKVKAFGGVRDWSTYAYEFTADGTYTVTLAYVKDMYTSDNDDTACFDNVRILSGDDAAAALAALPVYPTAQATTMTFEGDAKQIFYTDPSFNLMSQFGLCNYYVATPVDGVVTMKVTLTADCDPDAAFVTCEADGGYYVVADATIGEDGYTLTMPIDSNETSGYPYTTYTLYPNGGDSTDSVSVIACASEENANGFMAYLNSYGFGLTGWKYADGTLPSTDAVASDAEEIAGVSSYTIKCVDQNGDPVTGVMINVCTDETCTPSSVDENGVLAFDAASYAYVLHVLTIPEGYEFDTTQEVIAPVEGGEVTFVITKL